MASVSEQRNPYKGSPERCWVRVQVVAADGTAQVLELLADTGNPCAIVVGSACMALARLIPGPSLNTNFGLLVGGHIRLVIPEIGFDQELLGYASDAVVAAAQASSFDLAGLVGLPLLRLMQYGGDHDWFWVRPPIGTP